MQQPMSTPHCPRCRQILIADPNSAYMDDITCNSCEKGTNKVLSCRPCDFDLCYNCAPNY